MILLFIYFQFPRLRSIIPIRDSTLSFFNEEALNVTFS